MEFEELDSIYEKFVKEKLDTLKYPDISPLKYFSGFGDNPFRQVGFFLRKHDVPYANLLRSSDGCYEFIATEKKNFDTAKDFSKAQWNYYRQIYNKSYSEAEYLKKKYLKCLNERQYEEYYAYGLTLIDSMLSTEAGKQGFKDNAEYFIKVVVTILGGQFKDLKYIYDNPDQFPLFKKDEIQEYLENRLPGNTSSEYRFFSQIHGLLLYLQLIKEFESIVSTIYQFESIALLEAGSKMPPVEVPCYKEGKDPVIGYKHKQINETEESDSIFKDIKPHKDEIYRRFGELKNELQVKPAFYKLKGELKDEGLEPEEYGLKEEPQHYNRAYNHWLKNCMNEK